MNLPLKRFYQSGDSITPMDEYSPKDISIHYSGGGGPQLIRDRRTIERSASPCHERPRRSYRNRSRSRERGDTTVHTKSIRRRSRSQSPPITTEDRDYEQHRLSTRKSGSSGWKRNSKDTKGVNRSHNAKNGPKNERGKNEGESSGRCLRNNRR